MNPRTLMILVLALLGLTYGLASWIQPADSAGESEKQQSGADDPQSAALYPYDMLGIREVLVHRAESLDLLRLIPGPRHTWRLTDPIEDRAEPALLAQLFQTLSLHKFSPPETAWSARTDAELGLAEPRVELEIVHESAPLFRLLIGTRHPDGSRAFARLNGRRCMVPLALLDLLERKGQTWRDHGIVEGPRAVSELIWEPHDGTRIRLTRQGRDWKLQEPIEGPLDPLRLGSLQRLLGARSSELPIDPLEDAVRSAAEAEAGRLTLRSPAGTEGEVFTQTLYLRSGVFLDPQRAFAMPSYGDDLAFLAMPAEELRSQRLLQFEPRNISSLRVTRPNGAVELRRGSRGWTDSEGELLTPAARKQLTAHLVTLANLEATEVRPRPEGIPPRQVTLSIANRVVERNAVILRYWPLAEGGTVVTAGSSTQGYFVGLDFEGFWNGIL